MAWILLGDWQVHDRKGQRKYLTATERASFLAAADGMRSDVRALCHVLAYSGCRVSEALNLQRHQIDAELGALTLRCLKRRKICFRIVPVPLPVTIMLLGLPPHEDGLIFHWHRGSAWRQVKRVMALAGISGPCATPRGLRHGLGMRAASESVPIHIIQKWLDHSSPVTSAIYCDAVGCEERALAERMW